MPLQGPTVREIREEYGREQAALLTETFNTHAQARNSAEVNLPAGVSQKERNGVTAAAIEETQRGLNAELRDSYISKDLEMVAAIEHREQLIEEYLSPKEATSEALGQFMNMDEPQVIMAADIAAQSGMEDTLRLLLSISRTRNLELAVDHIAKLQEDDGWEELLAELYEAQQVKSSDADPADRWETLAEPVKDKASILASGGGQSDLNIYGAMR